MEKIITRLHPLSACPGEMTFACAVTQMDGRYLFSRHRLRSTWEVPGGHREPGESVTEAARRELFEETGAADYVLAPVAVYSVERENGTTYGGLYAADVTSLGPLPPSEIAEVRAFDGLPDALTYPEIQPPLVERARGIRPLPSPADGIALRTANLWDADDFAHVLCQSRRENDAPFLTPDALERHAHFEHHRIALSRAMTDRDSCYLLAYDGTDPVGICAVGPAEDERDRPAGEISVLAVLAFHQGRGIGGALLSAGLAELWRRGFGEVILRVSEANAHARAFYEALGFRPDGAREPSIGREYAIRMRKPADRQ